MVEPREWLIRKDGYFYRPNCQGYTTSKFEAGRYTKVEAEREAAIEPWHMKAIHQDDVEDDPVSSRVRMDADQIAALMAENERLERERDRWERHATTGDGVLERTRAKLLVAETRAAAAERALAERAGGVKVPIGYALVPVEPTDRMVSAYVAAKPKGAGFNHPRKGDDKKAWFAAHEKKCRERWKAMLSVSALTEPATPSTLVDQITDDVWAADKSDENPAVIDRDGPAAPEGQQEPFGYWIEHVQAEPYFLRPPSYIPSGGNFKSTPLYTRPSEQAVTDEMVAAAADEIVDTAEIDFDGTIINRMDVARAAIRAIGRKA